jgi:hypothetical protein
MKVGITVVSLLAGLLLATTAAANPPGASGWTWTPALCKSYLLKYGVRIDDGRYFRANSSRDVTCAGRPYCEFDQSTQTYYYDHFIVAMVDRNLVYRTMLLHITGEDDFRVTQLRVYGAVDTVAELQDVRARARALVTLEAKRVQPTCRPVP